MDVHVNMKGEPKELHVLLRNDRFRDVKLLNDTVLSEEGHERADISLVNLVLADVEDFESFVLHNRLAQVRHLILELSNVDEMEFFKRAHLTNSSDDLLN